jgi:argininosuccinate synthase
MVWPMAQLVHQRNVLRSQQQNCQRNMQHSAFEGHWSLPLCSRLRKLKHKVNLRAKPSIRAALTSGKAYRWY